MKVLYHVLIAPLGALSRIVGRRARELRIDESAGSYWRPSQDYSDLRRSR